MGFNSGFKGLMGAFVEDRWTFVIKFRLNLFLKLEMFLTFSLHVQTAVPLDNYQSVFTNWCTIG